MLSIAYMSQASCSCPASHCHCESISEAQKQHNQICSRRGRAVQERTVGSARFMHWVMQNELAWYKKHMNHGCSELSLSQPLSASSAALVSYGYMAQARKSVLISVCALGHMIHMYVVEMC